MLSYIRVKRDFLNLVFDNFIYGDFISIICPSFFSPQLLVFPAPQIHACLFVMIVAAYVHRHQLLSYLVLPMCLG